MGAPGSPYFFLLILRPEEEFGHLNWKISMGRLLIFQKRKKGKMEEGLLEKGQGYWVRIDGGLTFAETQLSKPPPNNFFSPADLNYLLIYIKQFLS